MTFEQFLLWLQKPGINVAVGAITSFLTEYWPWFQNLPEKAKRFAYAGVCLIVPLVGAAAGCAMGYQCCGWEETFWPAVYQGGLVAFGVGTAVVHNLLYLGKDQ
jgi:hypothetical protein